MGVLALLLALTAVAVLLLVLYSRHLFKENRTRVTRHRELPVPGPAVPSEELLWRTVVDPAEATARARASKPFAIAYARAMSTAPEDTRAA